MHSNVWFTVVLFVIVVVGGGVFGFTAKAQAILFCLSPFLVAWFLVSLTSCK